MKRFVQNVVYNASEVFIFLIFQGFVIIFGLVTKIISTYDHYEVANNF